METIYLQIFTYRTSYLLPEMKILIIRIKTMNQHICLSYDMQSYTIEIVIWLLTRYCIPGVLIKPGRRDFAKYPNIWWRHDMETLSALLEFCVWVSSGFAKGPVMRSLDVFFDVKLQKLLKKRVADGNLRAMTIARRNCNSSLLIGINVECCAKGRILGV